tara:strand:+ start:504 stop:1400 length:897 start_codon:yes stop_codon:yes gene_type:complete
MKKIIITGANGQDGVILSKILIKNNFKVFGITKIKNKKKKIKGVTYLRCNLNNFIDINNLIKKLKPNCIVHLGSENPSYKELKKKKDFYHKNLIAIKNLINSIILNDKKIKFIFPGSSQMYGNLKKKVSEKNKFSPTNSYAKFRVDGHNFIMAYKRIYGLIITTIILFNHDSIYRNKKFILPRLIKAFKNKDLKFIKSIFNLNICGDFSHAEDICNAIFLLIKSGKNLDKIILSSNRLTYLNDIIKNLLIKNKIDLKLDYKFYKKNNIFGNNNLAKKTLNWKIKKNIFIASEELLKNF